eukprot:Gregarina_sp_Poly_1__298@NODE_1074_length_5174_cov_263_109262_g746_i0_p1_GENE_NODE_1074_length_5174_cov_263_109262_g746_i0NODE_1074_length_5174_cov_263_109262_g746_i0_p1_ORF_typecomplete_len504_score60_84_NODE_1074_length_5174_cov_263_109262_g746_i018573368
MPASFLREVLTAHELDELGLNDTIRTTYLQPPKSLKLQLFFRLRKFLLCFPAIDLLVLGFLGSCHYAQWNSQRALLPASSIVSSQIMTLSAGAFYACLVMAVEAWLCVAFRQQDAASAETDARRGFQSWDVASAWNTMAAKFQVVLDVAFTLDCYRNERRIMSCCVGFVVMTFYLVPRILVSVHLGRSLFQPTPHRSSVIDFLGSLFGLRPSRRLYRLAPHTINFRNIKQFLLPASIQPVPNSKRYLSSQEMEGSGVTFRKPVLSVSYSSVAYLLLKTFCETRLALRKCSRLLRSFSLRRFKNWPIRAVCFASEDATNPLSREAREQSSTSLSVRSDCDTCAFSLQCQPVQTQTSAISPSNASGMEVEMETRLPERPRRSRGLVPGIREPSWIADLPAQPSWEEESPVLAVAATENRSSRPENRSWRRQVAEASDDCDVYVCILRVMHEMENTAIAEDSKIVEMTALATVNEHYLIHDILKEEYLAPDFREEIEFFASLMLFM